MKRNSFLISLLCLFMLTLLAAFTSSELSQGLSRSGDKKLYLKKVIWGNIRPKSIGYAGNGKFFAQNMMYRHSITVYDENYELLEVIPDVVELSTYGHEGYEGSYAGAPVEVSFSHEGQYAWVSNYQHTGVGLSNPGTDNCKTSQDYDRGFVYKVNTENYEIESVVKVGCVPKHLATTPDNRYVLVSNWCSGDLSVIDTERGEEAHRIYLGRYPRGIVIDEKSQYAYVAVMGAAKIAVIKLDEFKVAYWLEKIGKHPRHLCLDPSGKYLYASLNSEGKVAKLDLRTKEVVEKIYTGRAPRSMVLSPQGEYLYVTNYRENTVSKILVEDMSIVSEVSTNEKPIGIAYHTQNRELWVACYTGSIMIFDDGGDSDEYTALRDPNVLLPAPPQRYQMELFEELVNPSLKRKKEIRPPFSEDADYPIQEVATRQVPIEDWEESSPTVFAVSDLEPSLPKAIYCLIIGSYSNYSNAKRSVGALDSLHLDFEILKNGGKGFRVSGACFHSFEQATQAKERWVDSLGIESWVLKRPL